MNNKGINLYKLKIKHNPVNFEDLFENFLAEFRKVWESENIKNKKIGILVSSRGIKNIDKIIKGITEVLHSTGNITYLIPSMGSHGKTLSDQKKILLHLGIDEKHLNSKIISSRKNIKLGNTPEGIPVTVNGIVEKMDFLIGINRIKPHPRYSGKFESGLLKLLVVGLGGKKGAEIFHENVNIYGFEKTLTNMGKIIIEKLPIKYLIGIVEDCVGMTYKIKIIKKEDIFNEEPKLLNLAKEKLITLPFKEADILIINEMGKNYSGAGIDTCIIGGRKGKKRIAKRIYVRELSDKSNGNAIGMGLVDFISKKFFQKIDFHKTYTNCLTSMMIESAKIPLIFDTDYETLKAACKSLRKKMDTSLKIAWIKNTLDLTEIVVSEALLKNIKDEKYQIHSGPFKLSFDKYGNLIDLFDPLINK